MAEKSYVIFGIIVFFLAFSLIYVALGNALHEFNNRDLPSKISGTVTLPNTASNLNPFDEAKPGKFSDTNKFLGFVTNGIEGYGENTKYEWVNYFFLVIVALLVFLIVITLLHG